MKITTEIIEDKLFALSVQYEEVKADFDKAEQAYTLKRAELMMSNDVIGFANQTQRDSATELALSQTEEYKKYQELKPKMDINNQLTRIWMTIARIHQWGS